MEQPDRGDGKVRDLDVDAPTCLTCGNPAVEMYESTYEFWLACKAEPECASCVNLRTAAALRQAALGRGFRVGV